MADDRSILSGDEADLMSCNSVEYRTALGSVMEDDPQGQPGSNPQIPWHHMYYQGDTGQMAPPENFFDERPPDGGFYEPFDQTGAQRPMYDSAPLQQPTAQYMDHVLPSAPPMVTVEDWDEGQNDFVLEHYQHGGVNADLTMQHPVREELSMLCPNFLLEDRELDDNFLANLEYSTAPWTHLSVEGGGTSVASELHHINPSDSSREPSAGMRSGSGRSSLLDGADNGTSYTSAEPYQQNMADSMMTERPPLIAQNVSYAAQWNESPTGTIFSHDTLSLERTPRNPVTTRSEWSAIDEYRASSSSFDPRSSITSATRRGSRATSPASSTTPPDVPHLLRCHEPECSLVFTGKHRRGTLHRHIRLKHRGQHYPCQICGIVYQRQDARLKHYRNKHNKVLHLPVAVPRK